MSERQPRPLLPELELEAELNRAIREFGEQHGALVRRACSVPESMADLEDVLACTFFGHALSQVRRNRGSAAALQLAQVVLQGLDKMNAPLGKVPTQ